MSHSGLDEKSEGTDHRRAARQAIAPSEQPPLLRLGGCCTTYV
jgi:hypothetical protein